MQIISVDVGPTFVGLRTVELLALCEFGHSVYDNLSNGWGIAAASDFEGLQLVAVAASYSIVVVNSNFSEVFLLRVVVGTVSSSIVDWETS